MKALIYLGKYYSVALALLLFAFAFSINSNLTRPIVHISNQVDTWNLNDKMITNFNLGFKRLGASFLWISTILESDLDHYKKKDLNSWMFLRFNTISKLDPKFYENYIFGGMYLSIVKDDLIGASSLYKSGLSLFPNDYSLLKDAGYHFYFEVNDMEEARKIYSRLKNNSKFSHLFTSRLAKIEAGSGNLDLALEMLNDLQIKYPTNDPIGNKIYENRYAIRAELDLTCLNNNYLNNCNHKDLNQNDYVIKNGRYFANKAWVKFRYRKK